MPSDLPLTLSEAQAEVIRLRKVNQMLMEAAQSLCDRLQEFRPSTDSVRTTCDFYENVVPAHHHLWQLLTVIAVLRGKTEATT